MSSLKDLSLRIGSVKSTQKITSVMKSLSASKLYPAQRKLNDGNSYHQSISSVLNELLLQRDIDSRPQLRGNTKLLIVMLADKGLCGGFNGSIAKKLIQYIAQNGSDNLKIIGFGNKIKQVLKQHSDLLLQTIPISKIAFNNVVKVYNEQLKDILYSKYHSIEVIYHKFAGFSGEKEVAIDDIFNFSNNNSDDNNSIIEKKLDDDYASTLKVTMDMYIVSKIYNAILNSIASEHLERMLAMENANNNALDMIKDLSLQYNRMRQANITKELIEIISGSGAMEATTNE
ncbi:MAG: ATP synthase F1 subunit gamma [Anaplasmataceae bacterium]|nr:ATP synthase F1 subunit gamma [Anaplasmataceae bacterium]